VNTLLLAKPDTWQSLKDEFAKIKIPEGTAPNAMGFVKEAMKQNLLFTHLQKLLSKEAHTLLAKLSIYQDPITITGIRIQVMSEADVFLLIQELNNYRLLQQTMDRELDILYYQVPPIIRGFMSDTALTDPEWKEAHKQAGFYYKHRGKYFSRLISDGISGMYHFRKAKEDAAADELAEGVTDNLFGYSQYARVIQILEPVLRREKESVPWWAWNNTGRCARVFGKGDAALSYYSNALEKVENSDSSQ